MIHTFDVLCISTSNIQIDFSTDEGVWNCSVSYELAPSIDRTISSTLNLDVPGKNAIFLDTIKRDEICFIKQKQ